MCFNIQNSPELNFDTMNKNVIFPEYVFALQYFILVHNTKIS